MRDTARSRGTQDESRTRPTRSVHLAACSMSTPSVPFTVRRRDNGLSETKGCLYIDGDEIVVETQTTMMGLWRRSPKEHRLELTDLETVSHKQGLLGDRLTVRTRPMALVSRLPGAAEGALVLSVARRDRDGLDRVLERLELWLS